MCEEYGRLRMDPRNLERKDLDISNGPDERIKALNKSIRKGNEPVSRISPLVGKQKNQYPNKW